MDAAADIFIGKAKKYNQYSQTQCTPGRKCRDCIRWRFSYPYTCNDYDMYSDKAETCLNYDTSKDAKVD